MSIYRCFFLGDNDNVVSVEILGATDADDARREARSLMVKTGRFRGYELWEDGRRVDTYRPVHARA